MNIPYVFKRCSKCREWLVASTYNFNKRKDSKDGLRNDCRKCRSKYGKKYREQNQEYLKEYRKQHYEENKDYYKKRNKQYREQNQEYIKEYKKEYYKQNQECIKEHSKKYYEENKYYYKEYHKQYRKQNQEYIKERKKQYYEQNKNYIKEKTKQWYKQNQEHCKEYHKQYRKEKNKYIKEIGKQYRMTPQGQIAMFNSSTRRRMREQNQGDGIDSEKWLEMMIYFDFKCAYSGKYIGGNNNQSIRSIDHIKSLNQGGEHEIWNLVPMYRPYNSSKNDKELLEWYKEQPFYSEKRLQKIYEWQEYAYNKWHKEEII